MTQALPRATLAVKITPILRPYELTNSLTFATRDASDSQSFLLCPGELGEIQIDLHNGSDRPRLWRIKVQGNFAASWFIPPAELPGTIASYQTLDWAGDGEIAPLDRLSYRCQLQVPQDFFEQQEAIDRKHPHLQLEYQGQIQVEEPGIDRIISYEVLHLYTRPWCSYLNFLPSVYRETDFMGRLLSIFEQAFDPVVQSIDVLWAYLDPLTAPEALLPFLAHWVAWEMDDRWSVQQQRHLIRNAISLYRWHGTQRSLRFYLRLYIGLPVDPLPEPEADEQVEIEESSQSGMVFGKACIGHDTILGGGKPYHFIVRLRLDRSYQVDRALIQEVIERQKPAFCTYELLIINSA